MVLKRIAGKVEVIANVADFIRLASPVRVDTQDSASVLRRLYRPGSGEKVLIFSGEKPVVVLPGGDVTITDCAAELFGLITPTKTVFAHGGAVVTLTERDDGMLALDILRAAARSLFEKHARLFAWRTGAEGEQVLKPTRCAQDMSDAILQTQEARTLLPRVGGLINCPVIRVVEGRAVASGKGYDPVTRLLVTGGRDPRRAPV